MRPFTIVAVTLLYGVCAACHGPSAFNITAISAKNDVSRLECWQLDAEPELSRAATNFDLGEFSGGFVGILPPHTTSSGTLTNAQTLQYVLRLTPLSRLFRCSRLTAW